MLMGIKEIEAVLPHRHPFLLVDCIEELEPGVRAVGYKCVTFDEPYFRGHFPGNPVMPGVLIIEALAQVGAVAMLAMPENRGRIGFLGAIKNARFRRQVRPGDVLELECGITRQKGPGAVAEARATVEGRGAVTAELTFALGEKG